MQEDPTLARVWRKIKQTLTALCQPVDVQVVPIALFIDGENISSDLAVHILAEVGK